MKRCAALLLCMALLFCTACGAGMASEQEKTGQELYNDFLTKCFYQVIEEERVNQGGAWRQPAQYALANKCYAYFDVDQDGRQDLVFLNYAEMAVSEWQVTNLYMILHGAVTEVPVRSFDNDSFAYPVIMNNGMMRATIGDGHIPGYEYLRLINGAYVVTDRLTPPCNTAIYSQTTFEHVHYNYSFFSRFRNGSAVSYKKETISEEEFDDRVFALNDGETPARLDVSSLLDFGEWNELSIDWLDPPSSTVVSFTSPKEAPLPLCGVPKTEYDAALAEALKEYYATIAEHYDWDSSFRLHLPQELFYAFYDLDGNGDKELIFGESNENYNDAAKCAFEDVEITKVLYWTGKEPVCRHELWIDQGAGEKVLSNGWIVADQTLYSYPGSFYQYYGITAESEMRGSVRDGLKAALWQLEDEAVLFDYSSANTDDKAQNSVHALTREAYERQRNLLEDGAEAVKLDWHPIESQVEINDAYLSFIKKEIQYWEDLSQKEVYNSAAHLYDDSLCAFIDLDEDGTEELLMSDKESRWGIEEHEWHAQDPAYFENKEMITLRRIYTVKNGRVVEVDVETWDKEWNYFFYSPAGRDVMTGGLIRACGGALEEPGYAYYQYENGELTFLKAIEWKRDGGYRLYYYENGEQVYETISRDDFYRIKAEMENGREVVRPAWRPLESIVF